MSWPAKAVTYVYDLLQTDFTVHHAPGAELLEHTADKENPKLIISPFV